MGQVYEAQRVEIGGAGLGGEVKDKGTCVQSASADALSIRNATHLDVNKESFLRRKYGTR